MRAFRSLLEIPYNKEIARWYSIGVSFVEMMVGWKGRFAEILTALQTAP